MYKRAVLFHWSMIITWTTSLVHIYLGVIVNNRLKHFVRLSPFEVFPFPLTFLPPINGNKGLYFHTTVQNDVHY